jgi:nicotinamidase-related amidase/type 1 glutamine amidotransferase
MRFAIATLTLLMACLGDFAQLAAEPFEFNARFRQRSSLDTNRFEVVQQTMRWDPAKTAIIICDMWDRHWCKGATARVAEMAPRMNEVIQEARKRGALIIHAPSETMRFYADWPQRKHAQEAPKSVPPQDVQRWQSLDAGKEPPLPIDDSDGGCDDLPQCPQGGPWKRQIATLEIAPNDAISDRGDEVYNLLQQHGRDQVLIMGVHENMCVLGRPFSIRQMVRLGKKVLLMRDMTDTMYNSRRAPYVSHFVGTDLVAEHIEKYWCPTVTSVDILGSPAFRFQGDYRPKIVFMIGEHEYRTWETLPAFAASELAWRGFETAWVNAPPAEGNEFTNASAIASADLLVISVRRRTPLKPVLDAVRQHWASGKPIIGLRTASHAFAARPPDAEHAAWDTFDRDVLGVSYQGHYASAVSPWIERVGPSAAHPLMTGVPERFPSKHSLYRSRDLAPVLQVLLSGVAVIDGRQATEPVAWAREDGNRRVFYTSLGGAEDFREPGFRRLLLNAVHWTLNRPIAPAEAVVSAGAQ